jgi:hypothetical protein
LEVVAGSPGVLRRARAVVLEGTPAESALRITTMTLVLVGLWLRSRGFLFSTLSLGLDEASWAIRLMDKPLLEELIRPIGFMAFTRAFASVFGPSETVLRLLPWCCGVATTLMAPALANRLFRAGAARLLFVAVVALDPGAIDLSKEFKPYAVGLALHLGLVLLVLRYCDSGKPRDLAYALGATCLSVLFAQDVMFAYPALFLVLAISALRARRFRHLVAVAFAGAIALSVVASLYVFVWSRIDHTKEEKYWGRKYNVFYVPSKTTEDQTDWTVSRYEEIVAMPGSRRRLWKSERYDESRIAELRSFDSVVWILLHVAGLTFIIRTRRWREALLLVLPLDVTTAFNVFGFWPLGEFRTNLFALVYAAAIAAFAVERNAERVRWEDFIPAAALVLAPLLAFERTWHAEKHMYSTSIDYRRAMRSLVSLQAPSYPGQPERLVADSWTCDPLEYYSKYHPRFSRKLGKTFASRFELVCAKGDARKVLNGVRNQLRRVPRVWLAASKGKTVSMLGRSWPDDLEKVVVEPGDSDHLVLAVALKAAPAPEPAAEPADAEPEPAAPFAL